MAPEVALNGWHAVPVDPSRILGAEPFLRRPAPLLAADVAFPDDDAVVGRVRAYAEQKLPRQTLNHSMRVYHYAAALARQQLPELAAGLSPGTLALACLLHDIGTAEEHMAASRMSFDLYGAVTARRLVMDAGGPQDQADAVCEAVIRHQDLGVDGAITFLGQLLQLATIYDNVGEHPEVPGFANILHRDTREDVIRCFPRDGWLPCFAATLRREVALKPWCHTTHIPDFEQKVMANKLMKPYE